MHMCCIVCRLCHESYFAGMCWYEHCLTIFSGLPLSADNQALAASGDRIEWGVGTVAAILDTLYVPDEGSYVVLVAHGAANARWPRSHHYTRQRPSGQPAGGCVT